MEARLIKTSFYSDPKVERLTKNARWLFMYCLTNQYVGLTGAFELSDERLMWETKLSNLELLKAKQELKEQKLVYFDNSWIVVMNTEKHNNYKAGKMTGVAYEKEFSKLPENIQGILTNKYPIDRVLEDDDRVSIPQEIRNKKQEIDKGVVKGKPSPEDITEEIIEQTAIDHGVPVAFVRTVAQKIRDYCLSTGKSYRDYPATLRNWVKRDAEKIVQATKLPSKSFDAGEYLRQKGTHEVTVTS